MHMGYIFLGIASFGVLGVTGAVVLMFAHGLSIALLFGIAGELRRRTGTLDFDELGGLARVMPFAGLAFGLGVFAAIGLPGFANFAGEIMIFFGAFKNGWEIGRFHIFQIATVLALWGVVLSTVYMLRAYRKTFMGSIREQWQNLPDLSPALRVPVTLLVAALLCFGFLPQFFVRNVAPTFGTLLSANTSHFANKQRYSLGPVSANGAEFIASMGQMPEDPWNKKTSALKTRLIESRLQRSYWFDQIPEALPQAHMTKAPLTLDRYGAVRRPRAAAVTDEDAPQARRHNDLATK
jgi:NADH:ubiquinone oxidoreductase subunit 5 (subunit L)/multisubunit Na+/H+ antiporter MnhA subunit